MTWPKEHGGGRPGIERMVVAEEMIRVGAPIAASWIADRQMGPSICNYGSEEQQRRFLPGMLSGETTWCIGMSDQTQDPTLLLLQLLLKGMALILLSMDRKYGQASQLYQITAT